MALSPASSVGLTSEQAAAAYIAKALADAKGDLLAASAADTVGRLAVGTNAQVLTADSGEALGVKWADAAGGGIPATILDAKGDIIAASAADTAARLAVGTDGYVLTALAAAGSGLQWLNIGWTVVTKGSDESVTSNTVLQADDALTFATVNNAIYEVELSVIFASPAGAGTPDIAMAFGEDANVRGSGVNLGRSSSDAAQVTLQSYTNESSTQVVRGTAAANRVARMIGWYVAGGGSATLMWAQGTSDVNATIVRAGSVLRYRRLA